MEYNIQIKFKMYICILFWGLESCILMFEDGLHQWLPTVFHLHTSWWPISINCTVHICKMFVINIVTVTSNLYVNVRAFFHYYSIFFTYPTGLHDDTDTDETN